MHSVDLYEYSSLPTNSLVYWNVFFSWMFVQYGHNRGQSQWHYIPGTKHVDVPEKQNSCETLFIQKWTQCPQLLYTQGILPMTAQ